MLHYPMKFNVQATAKPGINVNWQTSASANDQVMSGAIPPEFGGPGTGLSPEDFYALAIVNCFMATFKVYAEKSDLLFEEVQAEVTLEVDRDEKGFPWMARAHLKARLVRPSSAEKGELLLNKSVKGCLVMNSIKTEKTAQFEIIT